MYCIAQLAMEALLLEDSFEDIFSDPALLECADNPDGDSKPQAELEGEGSTSEMVENTATMSSRKIKSLNKTEKGKLVDELRAISGVQLLDVVVRKLSEENHMQFHPERAQLMSSLLDSSSEEMVAICAGLADNFVCTYLDCDKGKDKYARFQVQWHQSCSKFLLPVDEHTMSSITLDKLSPDRLWHALTRSITQEVRNPLMIAISAAIYGFMLQQARVLIKGSDSEHHIYMLESEPDEVYLRFGGGALADMFTQRYKGMKSNKASKCKERISQELQVLECIRRVDKSTLPATLAYRDRGGMFFPDEPFLPFIKSLDECVRENTNEEGFTRYGKNLVKIATEQVQQNQVLFKQFKDIHTKVGALDFAEESIVAVYNEFSRKISNTRISEFLDTFRQKTAAGKGKATLSGQNLRDTLLSQHVNLRSKCKK